MGTRRKPSLYTRGKYADTDKKLPRLLHLGIEPGPSCREETVLPTSHLCEIKTAVSIYQKATH